MAFSVSGCRNVNITRDNNVRSAEMQQWNKGKGEFTMETIFIWSNVVQLIVPPLHAAHSHTV
jgi:hypothetical protein